MSPESASISEAEYPLVNDWLLIVLVVVVGVPLALDDWPVITFVPLKAVWLPFESTPSSLCLVWMKYKILLVESHSTTLPTAFVDAWLISSSIVNDPDILVKLTALVALKVVAEAAEPPDLGSLIKVIFLKSFATVKSLVFEVSYPSSEAFIIT